MSFNDLTLGLVLTRAAVFLGIAALVGLAMALGARIAGDDGVRRDGRISINPFVHIDILGWGAAAILGFGWIKPLDPPPARRAVRLLAVAFGLLMPLAIGFGTQLLLPWLVGAGSFSSGQTAGSIARQIVALSFGFTALNWLPLPPLVMGLPAIAALPTLARLYQRGALGFSLAMGTITALLVQSGWLVILRDLLTGILR